MRRREFITVLGSASVIASRGRARAAQPAPEKRRVIGILANEAWGPLEGLRRGLRELGYVEGRSLTTEYRFAEGRTERYPALARELIGLPVELLIAVGTPASLAAKEATTTVPVIAQSGDPLTVGLVANLARPGGNVTGMSTQGGDAEGKRVGLLQELVPAMSRLAVLSNPTNPYCAVALAKARQAASALRLPSPEVVEVADADHMDRALVALSGSRPDAVLVLGDGLLVGERARIANSMLRQRLPSMYTFPDHVRAGGLASYGTNFQDIFRRMALLADKILNGAAPGDLPVQQPTVFDLLVNLRTARDIGLSIPSTLLARADEVIE